MCFRSSVGIVCLWMLVACRATSPSTNPNSNNNASSTPIEIHPLAPTAPSHAANAADAGSALTGVRTPEGFLRTKSALTQRSRHVNVIELPRGTLPIDVDLTGSAAAPTISARLKRDLVGWKDKDIGAMVTRSPDGRYAYLEGGMPRELVVVQLNGTAALGPIIRRAKDPYRRLMWMAPHDLVADDGKALLRVDGSTNAPFVAVGRSPTSKLAKASKDGVEEVIDLSPTLTHALTHLVGPEIYGLRNASILDLDTGTRRELMEVEKAKKQEIVDIHLGLERTCVVRFEGESPPHEPLPPATYLCAPSPWQSEAFAPLITTRNGAGYLATANKRVVLLVDRALHVFNVEAKTDRVYPAPVAYSVASLDEKTKFLLSPGPKPLLLDTEAETLDALDGWVPSDIGGYSTSLLPPSASPGDQKLRIFIEAHGDRFRQPPPNERRLFILEIE